MLRVFKETQVAKSQSSALSFILCEMRSHLECSPKPGKDGEARTDEI